MMLNIPEGYEKFVAEALRQRRVFVGEQLAKARNRPQARKMWEQLADVADALIKQMEAYSDTQS